MKGNGGGGGDKDGEIAVDVDVEVEHIRGCGEVVFLSPFKLLFFD